MLSAFPPLLSYSQLSPFFLRIGLGAVLLFWLYRALREPNSSTKNKALGIFEGIIGLLILIGLWTQVAALVVIIDLVVRIVNKIMKKAFLTDGVNYYFILLIMALSLIVTGAGWLAFDLPL